MRRVTGHVVVFRGQAARREQGGPRGHDEGPSGSGECFAERLDGLPVGAGGGRGVAGRGEIVDVGGVDHAVRFGRPGAQAVQVGQGAAVNLGARGRQRCGGLVRAGQAGDVVARFEQLADDGGADEPGRAGHENTHDALLWEGDVSRSWMAPSRCRPVLSPCPQGALSVQVLCRNGPCVSGITAVHSRALGERPAPGVGAGLSRGWVRRLVRARGLRRARAWRCG